MLLILAERFQVLPLVFFRYLRVLAEKFTHLRHPFFLARFIIYARYLARRADLGSAVLSMIPAP